MKGQQPVISAPDSVDYNAIARDIAEQTGQEHLLPDAVDHPPHYNDHPSGIETIEVTEHFNFCRGNAIKYIWRAGRKGDEIEDLRKARWYLDREIARLEKLGEKNDEG